MNRGAKSATFTETNVSKCITANLDMVLAKR